MNSGVIHFDGITKATVSALVINDTIISAALKVARTMIDKFNVIAGRAIKDVVFEKLTFEQLLQHGYIFHWQMTKKEALSQREKLFPMIEQLDILPRQHLIDIYAAFVDIAIIGRNLLGDHEYQYVITCFIYCHFKIK